MKFASTRLVASDIKSMVAFYELVTGYRAELARASVRRDSSRPARASP